MARSWFRSGLMLVGLGLGLGTLVLSCSQKVTEKTAPAPEAETVVTGTLDVSGEKSFNDNKSVDIYDTDKIHFNKIDATLRFAAEGGVASNIKILSKLEHGWVATIGDGNNHCASPIAEDGTSCTISITLDPTDIDLGDGDLHIPFQYDTATGTKTGTVSAISYHSDHLKWKSQYVPYDIGSYYQDSSLVVAKTTDEKTIYFTAGNSLYALNPDGTSKWKIDFTAPDDEGTISGKQIAVINPALSEKEDTIYLSSYPIYSDETCHDARGNTGYCQVDMHYIKVTELSSQNPISTIVHQTERRTQITPGNGGQSYYQPFTVSPPSTSVVPIVWDHSNGAEKVAFLGSPDGQSNAKINVVDFASTKKDNSAIDDNLIFESQSNWGFLRSTMSYDNQNNKVYVSLSSPLSGVSMGASKIFQYDKGQNKFSNVDTTQDNGLTFNPISTPTFSSSGVYVGSYEGRLINWDGTSNKFSSFYTVSSCTGDKARSCQIITQPLVSSSIYFGTTSDVNAKEASGDDTFYAIDSSNGSLSWSIPAQSIDSSDKSDYYGFTSNPVMSGNMIYAIGHGYVMAMDSSANAKNSRLPWIYNVRRSSRDQTNTAGLTSNPVLNKAGDTLYVLSNSGYLYALKVGSSTSVTSKQTVPQAQKKTQ